MSKAPKQKKAQLHYQPYQSSGNGNSSNGDHHGGMESFNVAEIPLSMDPVLTGLSSNLSRNLWDDWNENDANFSMKFDMFNEDGGSSSNSNSANGANPNGRHGGGGGGASSHPPMAPSASNGSVHQQHQRPQHQHHQIQNNHHHHQQQHMNVSMIPPSAYDVMSGFAGNSIIRPMSAQSNDSSASNGSGDQVSDLVNDAPRVNYRRSLSEDIVSMLDENNELVFDKQQQANGASGGNASDARRQVTPPNGLQQQQQQQQAHMQQQQQLSMQQQQQELQYQLQRQQLQQQMAMASENARWLGYAHMHNGMIMQHQRPDLFARRNSAFEAAVAAGSTTLSALPNLRSDDSAAAADQQQQGNRTALTPTANTANAVKAGYNPFMFPGAALGGAAGAGGAETESADPKTPNGKSAHSPSGSTTASDNSSDAGTTSTTSSSNASANGNATTTAASNGVPGAAAAGPFGAQAAAAANGMMMPGFMMYPMPMMGNYPSNPMGMMPMQIPMGMGMGMGMGAMGAMGMQLPMGMQMPMGMGMQMPMGMSMGGMGMGAMGPMGIQLPMGMQVSPQSGALDSSNGRATDMEVTPAASAAVLKPATTAAATTTTAAGGGGPRALQPKDPRGPGFVSIARKPEEPEVSSILKSLMDEETKKKEKKLERNRDSARESRKKQQTYVETLETGIKRLQINRDLVVSYRWGVTGPGFGPLPCPQSPQMYDWKLRISIVTGHTEAFTNIQNPAGFNSLMRMNRQRRALSLSHYERERAVAKSFIAIGKRLAALRARVLEAQMLRTFSQSNPLAAELSEALNLRADQKLQLQCHAQRVFDEEVVQMIKLFKVFFALRNEAMRLNILSPSLELFFRDACSLEQLQKLLQWTETHRSVIENALTFEEVEAAEHSK